MKGRKRADRDADENLGQKLEPLLTKSLFLPGNWDAKLISSNSLLFKNAKSAKAEIKLINL